MNRRMLAQPLVRYLGGKTAKAFEELELRTVGDLLRHYPRRYEDVGKPTPLNRVSDGELVTVMATVENVRSRRMQRRRGDILEVVLTDGTERISLTFFNQKWRQGTLTPGRRGLFSGKVGRYRGMHQLTHPEYLLLDDDGLVADGSHKSRLVFSGGLVPIYPATARLRTWDIATSIRVLLDAVGEVDDPLPLDVRRRRELLDLTQSFECIHRPTTRDDINAARKRLRYEEAFVLQTELARRRAAVASMPAKPRVPAPDGLVPAFDDRLPFELTNGQREVGEAILADLAKSHPMHRLLQGDVGSGKTIVALRAMLAVVDAGGQTALLAPTEVLAAQHYRSICALLGPLAERGLLGGSDIGTKVTLLTGSTGAKARREAMLDVVSGDSGIVIGTHALLEEKVSFGDLGLVVIDEQHRFGVEQRAALINKALDNPPHVLVMTATPIPRTVAMTVFGDLEISTLTELPAGRQPIQSNVVPIQRSGWLDRTWARVREEVESGRQVYVVCPRVGDDGKMAPAKVPFFAVPQSERAERAAEAAAEAAGLDGEADPEDTRPGLAVLDLAPMLSGGPLAGLRVELLHGRMHPDAKDLAMRRFAAGDIDVLVATTVIEVGVDVPNASVMVIMDADRFGMSQLHQLRGRVGRGEHPGLCLLVTDTEEESPAFKRLEAVAVTLDGFELSRLDLEQRREGDVLGVDQSGRQSSLRMLGVLRDEKLIRRARDDAAAVVEADPELLTEPHLLAEIDALVDAQRAEYIDKS